MIEQKGKRFSVPLLIKKYKVRGIFARLSPFAGFIVYIMMELGIFLSIFSLKVIIQSLYSSNIYNKDFVQEYLMARAMRDGISPYLPIPDLASRYFGLINHIFYSQHPTPYPPPIIIISFPSSFFRYNEAAFIWLLIELSLVVIAVYMLLQEFVTKPSIFSTFFFSFLALSWEYLAGDLVLGQLNPLLLVLLILSWRSMKRNSDIQGGIFLGCAIALKLFGLPIVLYLLLKKKWKAIWATGLTFLAANLFAGFLIGFNQISYYYLNVSRTVATYYRAYEGNISLWSIGWRFFYGTYSSVVTGIEAPPLVYAPNIAAAVSILLPIILLVICIILAYQSNNINTAFGILIGISILASPIAWAHYGVLAIIPIIIIIHSLMELNWPKAETIKAIGIIGLLFIPHTGITLFLSAIATKRNDVELIREIPFGLSLFTLIPVVGILGILWLTFILGIRKQLKKF